MTAPQTPDHPTLAARWTCPFCPLLCDDLQPQPPEPPPAGADWTLGGGHCAKALAGLRQAAGAPASAGPMVNGQPASLDQAVAAAARLLNASQAPLFGGLGTDVAGGRALYRLACATGAISDAAAGTPLMAALRALQDRGGYTTTLAELRSRADLVLCVGGDPGDAAPRIFQRPAGQPPHRRLQLGGAAPADHQVRHVPLRTDLFDSLAELSALAAGRAVPQPDPALQALLAELHGAAYSVVIAEPARWGADAGLVVDAINRLVATLNQRQRAAALWLGGGDGAATVNQVYSWLSGLPLRSRAGPRGLEHDPQAWGAERLLASGSADALLWVASFGPAMAPPEHGLPMVVLGHAGLVPPVRGADTVFIPVATPGIGAAGHLVRTDGTVLLPLFALPGRAPGAELPGVAEVVGLLAQGLQALRAAEPAGTASAGDAVPAPEPQARTAVAAETEVGHG